MENHCKVVLGVIGSDCHVVGNRILESVLRTGGIEVINLGVMVSQDEFVEAAIDEHADAILVSSIYGHGALDCEGLRARCESKGIGDIILYVGGNLVIGKQDWSQTEAQFLEMGFDRVFPPSCSLPKAMASLHDDVTMQTMSRLGHNSALRGSELRAVA